MNVDMPDLIEISSLQEFDLDAAMGLSSRAGWNQTIDDWKRVRLIGIALGGKIKDRLVATASLTLYGPGGWVGMILVHHEFRRRGIGTTILSDLLLRAKEVDELSWYGLDATDLGRPLYEKEGFEAVCEMDRWQLSVPREFCAAVEITNFNATTDSDELRVFDLGASGVNRWCIMISFIRGVESKRGVGIAVARSNGGIVGYGVSRPGRISHFIGPIVASSPDVVGQIVSTLLAKLDLARMPVVVDVARDGAMVPWLKSNGFERVRSWTRMIKGTATVGRPEMIFASAGPELG
jgi:GNAT superfamily N-acetyltransferase